jgi:hypothetical protein
VRAGSWHVFPNHKLTHHSPLHDLNLAVTRAMLRIRTALSREPSVQPRCYQAFVTFPVSCGEDRHIYMSMFVRSYHSLHVCYLFFTVARQYSRSILHHVSAPSCLSVQYTCIHNSELNTLSIQLIALIYQSYRCTLPML